MARSGMEAAQLVRWQFIAACTASAFDSAPTIEAISVARGSLPGVVSNRYRRRAAQVSSGA